MSKSPKAFARRRQTVERYGVLAGDRQLVITIIQQTATQNSGMHSKIAAPKPALDRNLPQARRTEDRNILRVVEQLARGGRQPLRASGRPEKQMRVEQQPHRSP